MKIITKKVQHDFNLFLFGDEHTGSIMHHEDGWNQLVEMMNNPYDGLSASKNYGVDHGDVIEGILIDDPRYDGITTSGNVFNEMNRAVEMRKPIADKIITILDGNHPRKLWRFGGNNGKGVTENICDRLNIPFGTWSAKIIYNDNKNNLLFKHFCTHGSKSINSSADDPERKKTNMKLSLKRLLKNKHGDTVLNSCGHSHKLLCCKPNSELYIVDKDNKLKQKYTLSNHTAEFIHPDQKWYINTGSFYKLYGDGFSSYAEIAGYDPLELGFYIIKIRDKVIVGADKIVLDKTTVNKNPKEIMKKIKEANNGR